MQLIVRIGKTAVVTAFILTVSSLGAVEFGGGKLEYMNSKDTSFVGFGLFTSNKRFDAEIEGFAASQVFAGNTTIGSGLGSDYRLFFVAFSGYFHFIRTDKMSFYVGGGIMPWLPRAYAYNLAAGMDFFLSENWRAFYTFRWMENNADQYSYPTGASVSFGLKYAFRMLNI